MLSLLKERPIIIFMSLLLWILPRTSLAGTFSDNFDDGDLVGWNPNNGVGISVIDGELRFKAADPLIMKVGEPSWERYSLAARIRIAEFVRGGWFSIRIFQNNTGDNTGYYEFHLGQDAVITALYMNNRCVESFRVPGIMEEKVWHSVKIESSNRKVSFYLDGLLIAQLADVELSGYTDMCSTKGTHVYVDDVVISGPNIPDTGPSGPNSFAVAFPRKLPTSWGKVKLILLRK